jgi:hypothetical protein
MPTLSLNSGSLNDLQVTGSAILSGSASRTLKVFGSGSAILVVSGSLGGLLELGDSSSTDYLTITSGSVNLLNVGATTTIMSGSVAISGSLTLNGFAVGGSGLTSVQVYLQNLAYN